VRERKRERKKEWERETRKERERKKEREKREESNPESLTSWGDRCDLKEIERGREREESATLKIYIWKPTRWGGKRERDPEGLYESPQVEMIIEVRGKAREEKNKRKRQWEETWERKKVGR
jgi:hypothetical protein